MIRIGKKFFKPHFCPDCGKPVMLVHHPQAERCERCRRRHHRKSPSHRELRRKYNNQTYRRAKARETAKHPYCALCGSTDNLTCHHAVNVKNGEWRGKHFTILCSGCHELWERKINKIRSMN